MTFKKYLSRLTLLWMGALTFHAEARIPTVAFKGVTQHFKPGKEFYSPTLGIAAIESGLIQNLRFYGNYTASYNKENARQYIKDNSKNDPVWRVVHFLFPSSGGNLAAETEGLSNFGKRVISPETVALLLDYAHQLRTGGKYTFARGIEPTHPVHSKAKGEGEITASENPSKPIKKSKSQMSGQKEDHLNSLKEKIYNTLAKDPSTKESYAKELKKDIETFLHTIKEAIEYEKNSIYPLYTTEQIILAFFCEKFNSQQDIWNLIKALAEIDQTKQIIEEIKSHDFGKKDLFKKEDLEQIKKMNYLDGIYLSANADIFTRVIPYKDGTQPISNGSTHPYNRLDNIELKSETFADCIEEVMRHICNFMLYVQEDQSFKLDHLSNKSNNYLMNFKEFYDYQTPMLANNGDIETRTRWNKVVGDLNAMNGDKHKVAYNKRYAGREMYDMLPGFINVIAAFRTLLNLDIKNSDHLNKNKLAKLDINSASLDDLKQWVGAYLKYIFETLNPNYSYELDTSNLTKDKRYGREENDIFGKLPVKVLKKIDNTNLFSFTINFMKGHGQLEQLQSHIAPPPYDQAAVTSVLPSIVKGTSQSSLRLLHSKIEWKDKAPLYALYPELIQDDVTRIQRIEYLNSTEANPHFYEKPLGHLLDQINWEDDYTLTLVSRSLISLQEKYPEATKGHVGGFKSSVIDQDGLKNVFLAFPALKVLNLSGNKSIKELFVKGLPKLQIIDLYASSVSKTEGLEGLTNLRELNLSGTHIEDLSLGNLSKLKKINLYNSPVSNVGGLEKLSDLQELNLSETNFKGELSLRNLSKLEKLILSKCHVSKVNLKNLTSLQELNLKSTKSLQEISLRNLSKLQIINLFESNISQIEGLDKLSDLQDLNLSGTKKIQELSLKDLSKLQIINLGSSSVKKIQIENLTDLQELILSGTNLEKFSYRSKPLKVYLIDSNFSKLEGLPHDAEIIR